MEESAGGTVKVMKTCSRCGVAYYCSKECQMADWTDRGHQLVCKPIEPQSVDGDDDDDDDDDDNEVAAPAPAPAPVPTPMPMPPRPSSPAAVPPTAQVASMTLQELEELEKEKKFDNVKTTKKRE